MARSVSTLLKQIRACEICAGALPGPPNPVVRAHRDSRILVVGQAPGRRVDESGVPWDDPSGERLRDWLGVTSEEFYDERIFALVPMGFCYPGTGKSGDLPPRPECAPEWHEQLLERMENVRLTLLLSRYAIDHYLKDRAAKTLTETVRNWKQYRPAILPLPHPSPRNNRWLVRNPWFVEEVVPYLRRRVRSVIRA